MPIYAYRCSSCGFEDDYLQKVSSPPLTDCPKCGTAAFSKKLTAAGFQLKGSGWYATDFKNGSGKSNGKDGKSDSAGKDSKSDAKSETKSESAAPACGTGACEACS